MSTKTECPICYHNIKKSQMKTLSCSYLHVFHMKCIWKWLLISNTCPMCRETVEEYPKADCPYNEYIYYVNALVSRAKNKG